MNLRDLRYLVTVADVLNFSQAAEICHVSQPTLSNQIKKLEEWLGVQVFERNNRTVMITPIGADIIAAARRLLREAEQISEIASHARDPLSGTFRLGAFPTLSTYIFPRIVPALKAALPNLKLILIEEKTAKLIERLKSGEIDAAMLALPVHEESLVEREWFTDIFCLAIPAAHPLTAHKTVNQKELANYKLMLLEEGHCLRDQALEVCHFGGFEEEQDFRATGLETLRQMVKAGTGITIMPEIAKREEEGVVYVPFASPPPARDIGLVWRKTSARKELMEKMFSLLRNAVNNARIPSA